MSYNKKEFLLPDSHRSMACYHAKIEEDNAMKLTIHDCNKSIRLHNDLSNPEEVKEALDKLGSLAKGIAQLRDHILINYYKKNNQ
ncbi:hypothetical protein M2451_002739 [Dysgonomonas sp. PFB1-18]|uniref:hypothetical protein n=1 Tax=unclassified Dysgonomonas TaxID=2630389 RepID=UPI0024746D18|nr:MULTISPECIES: hypothetical protein [unclassified Dysgonomonas]MDH6309375.1 hypothetical protein [Dysgonomonas sp. PF1-14]MDH6339760.1 hypothetical protein [Dysgonomonas sp. PF1-16]MDH6381408.1 hypothetical protein [Dysgonomonas sp. PFB1-18]MDH6398623.1 hypothetical protein [Dysgonomonas sp. PF1-23]